ncbi:hypothetical protein H9N25_23870 [Pedobacter riviphilus]|uniref:Uncharacterized protein n=1 Tax=Pedobacter riviphilus TaxID=2766984 RepID=A0ABX6TH96_9SPHI|nr:contact-dependent growth inhibition system immunity protein [Pedobacter riviphilus]QNR84873.1 hypothetical protein H9N25_23870 [Pedobacter riviphilus]
MKKNRQEKLYNQKSLEILENLKWPDENEYPTSLIKRCHEYRKIPINELTVEQLRTLISQDIGLEHLIPITIEILNKDILAEGDLYPGDLLESALKIDNAFWTNNINLKERLSLLIDLNSDKIRSENLELRSL